MQSIIYRLPEQKELLMEKYKTHKTLFGREVLSGILNIFDEVASHGDEAILELTKRYDGVEITELMLTDGYIADCVASLTPTLRSAVERAIRNVREVNTVLLPQSWSREIRPGTIVGETVSPLESVGIWIPARKGPLLSTAVMLVAAAKTAGVKRIIVGMPPLQDGCGDPGTVAAARLAGADQFVIGNGVAVIAGFAQGTAAIPEVDGIFGPGPGGIAAAMSVAMTYGKRSALGIGPTESVILADDTADPVRLAYDLLNEGEHGPDSSSILVTTSSRVARETETALWRCIGEVEEGRRQNVRQVFGPGGKGAIIVATDTDQACDWVNWFAPEHLMVVCAKETEARVLSKIANAGEVLIGQYTPFSAANYGIGITAVLPTNHFARAYSGVTSKDMVKYTTVGQLSRDALADIAPVIRELSAYEQLPCHRRAADIRLADRG
ncbi:histidinol dehydrogenase [Paenibacillus doosanensis]|uniref:Histidinol dehydrogenase n=1 Tax=Paenibacillus konkukensis TaxID=2020716 RepID=A0ABY4RZA3_9BACL|nr:MULTISPECIES: histidinol dehydrogenase [Paenibacillus]MCS7463331.1 histidinol dehydrogenase [Paenibacillus doosanensis]UQZ87636.1 Histidinol dehydrogenase [Paenibacillus konkukensis]